MRKNQGMDENANNLEANDNLVANKNDVLDLFSDDENDSTHSQADDEDNNIAAPRQSNRLSNLTPINCGDANLVTIKSNHVDDQEEKF